MAVTKAAATSNMTNKVIKSGMLLLLLVSLFVLRSSFWIVVLANTGEDDPAVMTARRMTTSRKIATSDGRLEFTTDGISSWSSKQEVDCQESQECRNEIVCGESHCFRFRFSKRGRCAPDDLSSKTPADRPSIFESSRYSEAKAVLHEIGRGIWRRHNLVWPVLLVLVPAIAVVDCWRDGALYFLSNDRTIDRSTRYLSHCWKIYHSKKRGMASALCSAILHFFSLDQKPDAVCMGKGGGRRRRNGDSYTSKRHIEKRRQRWKGRVVRTIRMPKGVEGFGRTKGPAYDLIFLGI
jgi:hypothetical protein